MSAVVPVEQLRALVRLLFPDHMTPVAKRQIESVCEHAELEHDKNLPTLSSLAGSMPDLRPEHDETCRHD